MLSKVASVFAVLLAVAAQDTGTLRVRVALADAAGVMTPLPRIELLVSDNPATNEPRRVRTSGDGTVELTLKPGSYIVETDRPIAFGGKGYSWTQLVDVAAGRPTTIELGATNAEIGPAPVDTGRTDASTPDADSAAVFAKWKDSVVEIWTPTGHASGFLVDAKGMIATSHHAIAGATSVEVQITTGATEIKVPGAVVADDRLTGAAMIAIDPKAMSSAAIDLQCGRPNRPAPAYQDELTAIAAPMFRGKDEAAAIVSRTTSQAIFADFRLRRDDEGGPVFDHGGELIGISALTAEEDNRGQGETWIVPVDRACETLTAAQAKAAAAPAATHLPLESPANPAAMRPAAGPHTQAPTLSSSSFDITLLTPALARTDDMVAGPRSDFGNWSDYVRTAPPVLLIRVSPQFEESVLKKIARGAAATQGVALPPLKSFTANFLRLRAFCGDTEVLPIHPFIIERQVAERNTIKEGLYVFDPAAFGPECVTVRLSMYSEKEPQKADVKTIDAKLFQQVANSLQ